MGNEFGAITFAIFAWVYFILCTLATTLISLGFVQDNEERRAKLTNMLLYGILCALLALFFKP